LLSQRTRHGDETGRYPALAAKSRFADPIWVVHAGRDGRVARLLHRRPHLRPPPRLPPPPPPRPRPARHGCRDDGQPPGPVESLPRVDLGWVTPPRPPSRPPRPDPSGRGGRLLFPRARRHSRGVKV